METGGRGSPRARAARLLLHELKRMVVHDRSEIEERLVNIQQACERAEGRKPVRRSKINPLLASDVRVYEYDRKPSARKSVMLTPLGFAELRAQQCGRPRRARTEPARLIAEGEAQRGPVVDVDGCFGVRRDASDSEVVQCASENRLRTNTACIVT
eukprot:3062887-Rhodomonas_salina.3